MPYVCELKTQARPHLPLDAPGLRALADNHGNLTVLHAIDTLKRLYPRLSIVPVDSADPRPAWIEVGGRSVINLRHARLDSPFHEVGHIWEAALEASLPASAYDRLLGELDGTDQLTSVQQRYPEKNDRLQRREALVQLVGEQAAQRFAEQTGQNGQRNNAQTLARRIWQHVEQALQRFFGNRAIEGDLSLMSLRQVLAEGVDALTTTPSWRLTPKLARRLITQTLDQRPFASGIRNPGDLMELVCGQDGLTENDQHQNQAAIMLQTSLAREKAGQGAGFELKADGLGKGRTGRYQFPKSAVTDAEKQAFIVEKIREHGQAHREQLNRDAVSFFGRSAVERARLLNGDYASDADKQAAGGAARTAAEQKKERYYFRKIAELFPDFKQGDTVVPYTAAGAGEDYDPAVDATGMVLHKAQRTDPMTGATKTVVSLATLTDGNLGETRKQRYFLAGLYDGRGLRKLLGDLSTYFGHEVKLSATHENRQKMQVLLAAMHLKKRGYEVASLAVGKFSKEVENQNQVLRLFPTEHLATLKVIRERPSVRQALEASGDNGRALLALLSDDSLYEPGDYNYDYVEFLSNHYGAGGPADVVITKALGQYYKDKSATSLRALEKSIRRRQKQLIKENVGREYENQPEFIMLSDALTQLRGVNYHLNPWRVTDAVKEKYTSFLRVDHPILQYFVRQWDDAWYLVSQGFMAQQAAHQKATENLHEWYRTQHVGVGVREHLVAGNQGKYYEELYGSEQVDYLNPDTGKVEARTISTNRLLLPDSEEFKKLAAPQQQYIRWALATIKQRMQAVEKQRREVMNLPTDEKAMNEWYATSGWADGRIPVVQADVWQSVLKGDIAYATEEHLRQLLDDNPRFHDQLNDQEDRLNDFLLTQGDDDTFNAARGLEPHPDDPKRVMLRADDGLQANNRIEADLRRTMNILLMQTLKHELMTDMEVDFKVGVALLRHHEHALGLMSASPEGNSAPGQLVSPNEEMFVKMAKQLWLSRTNQNQGRGDEKKLSKFLATAGAITTNVILLGNLMVPVQTFLTQALGNVLPQAFARQGIEGNFAAPSAANLAFAVKEVATPANYDKLMAIARQLNVVRHGEWDLLGNRQHNGEPFRVFSSETAFALDRWGDNAIRLALMVAMLQQQGVYDAYSLQNTGTATDPVMELKYDTTKDKRSDKLKETLRFNLEREGVLGDGQPLDRPFDGQLRRTMELVISDSMGGYSPGTATVLGATAMGKPLRRLAGYMTSRIERGVQERRKNPNRVFVDDETGEFVPEEEIGQIRSALKFIGLVVDPENQGNLLQRYRAAKGQMGQEAMNISTLRSNLMLAMTFIVAGYGLQGMMDDKEQGRKRSIALRLLDSLISETFAFENFRSLLGKAASPIIELTMLKNAVDAFSNSMLPGRYGQQSLHQLSGRVGLYRTGETIVNMFDGE
jgi:hypothetical protein